MPLGEVAVGGCDLGAAVDEQNDAIGLFERDLCLLQDLCGDVVLIINDNAAGVDDNPAISTISN